MNLQIKELILQYLLKILNKEYPDIIINISFNNNITYGNINTKDNKNIEIIISEKTFSAIENINYQYNCDIVVLNSDGKKISNIINYIQKQIFLDFSKKSNKCLYNGFHNIDIDEYFISNVDLNNIELNGSKNNTFYSLVNLDFFLTEKN